MERPVKPSALIIIVTFNFLRYQEKSLIYIRELNSVFKLMFVDNASTDGTQDYLIRNFPGSIIIKNDKNLGFGAANNVGMRYAIEKGYKYVYLLNQDAWITCEDIMKLIKISESHPEFGIISPLHVYAGQKKIDNNFFRCLPKELLDESILNPDFGKEIYEIKGRTIQAAHWLVKTETIKTAGGFSPTFFHWGEDTNLCRRTEFKGYKLGVAPAILGVHDRENRKDTKEKKLTLKINALKTIISDPFTNKRKALQEILILLSKYLILCPKEMPVILYNMIKSLPSAIKNRKTSINENGAFL